MSIKSDKNLFPGINPHLNSLLQNSTKWVGFHSVTIVDLLKAMRIALRPLGYTADVEQSLQITELGDPAIISYPKSDVTIYDPDPFRARIPTISSAHALDIAMPIQEIIILEEIDYYKALVIYKKPLQGGPVVWVELLSPSNKPPHPDFKTYREKRQRVLESGIVFVEMDYLHESPPTIRGVANYAAHESDAYPYRITVIDPRPDVYQGEGRIRQFDASMPIPTVTIPLNDADVLKFDFNIPYQKTFEETLYGDEVDYEQLPVNFEAYNAVDQATIRQHMAEIVESSSLNT